jgi:hypothetical protein
LFLQEQIKDIISSSAGAAINAKGPIYVFLREQLKDIIIIITTKMDMTTSTVDTDARGCQGRASSGGSRAHERGGAHQNQGSRGPLLHDAAGGGMMMMMSFICSCRNKK